MDPARRPDPPRELGGPLIDLAGDVVGINELGGGGLGFAIPSSIARGVLRQALEKGEVERGWLGFSVLPVQKIGRDRGALVSNVLPGGGAHRAGLEAGDVLLGLDGEPVSVRFFEEVPLLYGRIAALPIGSAVDLEVEREGTRRELEAEVEKMPAFRGEEEEIRGLGITAQEITGPMAVSRNLPSPDGLLVTGVRPGTPAGDAKPSLGSDDVLRSVEGVPVDDLSSLKTRIEELTEKDELVVSLWRNEQEILSVIPMEGRARTSWGGELPKAWLGVRTQVLTPDLARVLGLEDRRGFRITRVLPWTEASEAGLRVGDLLVAVEGEPLEAERPQDSQELRRIVEELTIGEEAELTVVRRGAEETIPVLMEPRPTEPDEAETAKQPELEFEVRELTFLDRIQRHWSRELEGVIVEEATMGGWAHMAGLRLGDLIVEINRRPVPDVDRFGSVMAEIVESRTELVQIFVRRGERTHFVLIEPDWEELTVREKTAQTEEAA